MKEGESPFPVDELSKIFCVDLQLQSHSMGTDYLQLLDRGAAELIIRGNGEDLVALVESRTTSIEGPPVWNSYWDAMQEKFVDFRRDASSAERLKTKLDQGTTLEEIKDDLLQNLCLARNFLYVDYWGCWSEIFSVEGAPGSIPWEDFTAPMRGAIPSKKEKWGTSGCYLLTDDNVSAIMRGLETHQDELTIMSSQEVERVRRWQSFCRKMPTFCMTYQNDF